MKAYANIEFLFAGAVFISLVIYMALAISEIRTEGTSTYYTDLSMSRSERLFYSLFFDKGIPESWNDPKTAEKIGLMSNYWEINSTKLSNFMDYCNNNYVSLVRKYGRPFHISVSGQNLEECGDRRIGGIRRIMAMDGKPVVVEVGVA